MFPNVSDLLETPKRYPTIFIRTQITISDVLHSHDYVGMLH